MEMLPGSATSPLAVLASAREQVASLAETLWTAARPEELLDVNVEIERLRSSLAALQATVAVEVEATEAAKSAGWVSPGDWLTHTAGGRRGHGSRMLRTARPLCWDRRTTLLALQAGDVSPDHAEVIVAVIDRLPCQPALRDEAEAMLLDHAASLNASELRKAGDHLLEVLDPDGTARLEEAALDRLERSAHLGRFLTIAEDGIGGVRVRGRGAVEDAALIKTALHALSAPRPGTDPDCGETARDLRDHGARTWDALVETCLKASETDGLLPEQHGAKPRLTVTMTFDQLRESLGAATLDTGDQVSATTLRRLACDADVIPAVLGSLGEVLDVGRTQRLVTAAIWKALTLRDQHCRFPGCRRMPLACDAHHLQHWADGGATELDNLVLLCRAHHTLIHATPWQVRLNPLDRQPEFRRPPRHRADPTDHWIRTRPARE
ncbi:MAG: DUF222 domain-containing protein [Nocardioides sp.]